MIERGNGDTRDLNKDKPNLTRRPLSSRPTALQGMPAPERPAFSDTAQYVKYFDEQARFAPGVISICLESPEELVGLADQEARYIRTALADMTLHPRTSLALEPTWEVLNNATKNRRSPLVQRVGAALFADALHYQTGLPDDQRRFSIMSEKKISEKRIGSATEEKRWAAEQMLHNLDDDAPLGKRLSKGPITRIFDRKRVEKGPDLQPLDMFAATISPDIPNIDDVAQQVRTIDDMSKLQKGFLYQFAEEISGPDSAIHEFEGLMNNEAQQVLEKPEAAGLLLDGQLEDLQSETRYKIWRGEAVNRSILHQSADGPVDDQSIQRGIQATKYFRDHPEIREHFWNHLVEINDEGIRDEGNLEYAQLLLMTVPHQVEQMMTDIPLHTMDSAQRRSAVKQLTTAVAATHRSAQQGMDRLNEHLPTMRAELKRLAERSGFPGIIDQELAVIADEAPGAIIVTDRMEAKARVLSGNPDIQVVYVSSMPVPEKPAVVEKKDTRLHLEPGVTEVYPAWHGRESQSPQDEQVPALLGHVDATFTAGLPSQKGLDNYVWQLENKSTVRSGKAPAVYPELLPEEHPLRALGKAGVVAVEPSDTGYDFRVVVDAQKAGIVVEGGQTLIVDGYVDPESKEILLSGQDEDSTNLPVMNGIRGAALLARRPIIPRSLEGSERSTVLSELKAWNKGGNEPKLRFDEKIHPTARTVLFPIGGKTVQLTVDES